MLNADRICERCGTTYSKPENLSWPRWAERRFCGRGCGTQASTIKRFGALRQFCACGCGQLAARVGAEYKAGHDPALGRTYHKGEAAERFARRVLLVDTGCWEYQGYRFRGYGKFGVSPSESVQAHRFAYELWVGPIGDMVVHHRCENRACVRPDHLELKTNVEHTREHTNGRGWVTNQYGTFPIIGREARREKERLRMRAKRRNLVA